MDRLTRRELVLGAGALALGAGAADALGMPAPDPGWVGAAPARAGGAGPRALRELARRVRGPVIRPGSAAYAGAARVYNARFDGARPDAVVVPRDSRDVQALLRWADRHDVRVATRSGGHSYAGYSTARRGHRRRPAAAAGDLGRPRRPPREHRRGRADDRGRGRARPPRRRGARRLVPDRRLRRARARRRLRARLAGVRADGRQRHGARGHHPRRAAAPRRRAPRPGPVLGAARRGRRQLRDRDALRGARAPRPRGRALQRLVPVGRRGARRLGGVGAGDRPAADLGAAARHRQRHRGRAVPRVRARGSPACSARCGARARP